MSEKLHIEGKEISIRKVNDEDYISLSDMSNWDNSENARNRIANWMRLQNTLDFLSIWEKSNNPDFNYFEFEVIRSQSGGNAFAINPKQWIEKTNALGIVSKTGRYGGTFAHRIIAFEYGSWLSPMFKYYLVIEFERLKSVEYQQRKLEWDAGRFLSKVNHEVHTQAIQTNIVPRLDKSDAPYVYASEADLLNLAVFGITAKEWREQNPDATGNIRDGASLIQLIILSNLETHNADYIRAGASKEARYLRLCEIVQVQTDIFSQDKRLNDEKRFIE